MSKSATIAVIGRGLIGSAAARHLAKAGHETILIGPSEPHNFRQHTGVFASHYDEGRITRRLDAHPFWSKVGEAAIQRYAQIEAESGIHFFTECGALIIASEDCPYIAGVAEINKHVDATRLDPTELSQRFPYFRFDPGSVGFHEATQAGHVSPRRLVAAQTEAARRHGARIVDAVAEALTDTGVRTAMGDIAADHVIVATGAYGNTLLPEPLALQVYARTITFLEIDPPEAARLSGMPSSIWRLPDGRDPYMLPPIRYPDGRTFLKLGGDPSDTLLSSGDDISDWFRSGGNADVAAHHHQTVEDLIPGLSIAATHHAPCAVTFTKTGLPYIDRQSDRLTLAIGGCGAAAKSSDELGRLAAEAAFGQSDPALEAVFEA
ncbi:NAD(P)/FAD-dependent oxidoreductase [Halovulum sp. GXIMD14793]